mmetsp:Transcript_111524/g.310566  ORF Transcript_111524/g.310566 Transcript_111524/m.310566 type:complete len:296 (+) Transcript_111524:60-947(+)|eukprot:CAMPEP_0179090876 /NCGR_PEP_ID=MMETSP0796-20121207/41481_1 /TAXON_ID=73915 /ORGANISM="Pyrodinium bahamense, Strain pbaha01" /LENGTH=295 /DNA_ID=CAMNT_0020788451 /DNA_START=91 /DNA_END=978 /DNA_ORIENTATION=+
MSGKGGMGGKDPSGPWGSWNPMMGMMSMMSMKGAWGGGWGPGWGGGWGESSGSAWCTGSGSGWGGGDWGGDWYEPSSKGGKFGKNCNGGKGFCSGKDGKGGKGGRGGKDFPKITQKVFVGGLPKEPNRLAIIEYFSQFGNVTDIKMMCKDDGTSRGYCFISFDSITAAKTVVLDNYESNMIDGKWVDCKPADGDNAVKPGDWWCPMCGNLVFASKSSCNNCGFDSWGMDTSMFLAKAGKPGDWTCSTCGHLNFAFRDQCNKCGAPKPQAQLAIEGAGGYGPAGMPVPGSVRGAPY